MVAAIAGREAGLRALADEALRQRAYELRRSAGDDQPTEASGASKVPEVPEPLVADAFALVREIARRALGLRLHDAQILGGLALHRGAIAELATGEGKTLAAVAPAFLAALAGRGSHVLTFNDYLARRDAAWMGPVFERLGVTVGTVQEDMAPAARREAYARDVTYVTAKEAGFDFLRDGLCLRLEDQVHRPPDAGRGSTAGLHAAIVDEADSILIDEARVPLVIAGAAAGEDAALLPRLAAIARRLERGADFELDEHGRNVFLTDRGALAVEAELARVAPGRGGSLVAPENVNLAAAVRNALHAEVLLRRDVDYIVRSGAVELVDELTGRVAENRHWPDGLQAAVEAKEGLTLGDDGRILGSITLQHFLRLYPRLAGMTATARSAAAELREIYGLEVVAIAPHQPCLRQDAPDRLYLNRDARDRALLQEIAAAHRSGRPVLVGTSSVADSERLAAQLDRRSIAHRVLNAKNDEREAAVVAEAGASGAVTISTNMAGRGTDIKLGGHDEADRERVLALGGLYVLGSHRHESARIDDQLRGRAGRQGDPGRSCFLVSLDDDLLRRYGIDRLLPRRFLDPLAEGGDQALDSAVVRREVARAQRIAEGESFDIRRRLYGYSQMLEGQRRYVAEWRQGVLDGSVELDLLRTRSAERWERLAGEVGGDVLAGVERRLTLLTLDRAWSQYLADLQALRDEVHLVTLDGRDPLTEFTRAAMASFEGFVGDVESAIVERFATLPITAAGVDWDAAGLRGPSSTWTYLVSDQVFGPNVMRGLANRASIGLWGAVLLGPVLFAWGLYLHWKQRRKRRPTLP
jgi:preprotein translocase subunit SecA